MDGWTNGRIGFRTSLSLSVLLCLCDGARLRRVKAATGETHAPKAGKKQAYDGGDDDNYDDGDDDA
ncbi:hypothetical protein Dda_5782 [Drechslerella dactyloides]|uniref:Secreted protein n=1 Tax=Drechslerella dactyloides TaxID=74499 RepID=A0AAD6IV26_DREDA|nr:hypothetical protein Dda_5782 [Drechslerella dactyloides]